MKDLNLKFEHPAPYSMGELAGSPFDPEYSRKVQKELNQIFYAGMGEAAKSLVTTSQGRLFLLMFGASVLSACSAALPPAENPSFTPTIGPETNSDVSFGIIPTPEAIVNSEGEVSYPTETYCAPSLNICVAHQFGKSGEVLEPAILTSSEVVPDLLNNKVVLSGDLVEIPEGGYGEIDTDIDVNGKTIPVKGYTTLEPLIKTVQETREFVATMDLNDQGKAAVEKILQEAERNGWNVNITFRQIVNTAKDASGVERLVDMDESLWLRAGAEGSLAVLADKLEPFDKVDLLSGMQIAGVEVVNRVGDIDELVMEVYPSDWKDNGAQWVGPGWFDRQTQIAAAGERFTLNPEDGTIQDGATTIPGLQVSKDGKITIAVGDELVTLDPAQVKFDDINGFLPDGYTQDENGEWVEAFEIARLDNGVILTFEDKNGDGISEVTEVSVDNDNLTEEQKEMLVNQLNPGYVGFTPDEAKLYYDAESQKLWVGVVEDPSNVIARQDIETGKLIWDYDKMVDENGESILFRIAHTWEMKGVNPVDMEAAKIDSGKLYDEIIKLALENGQFAWGRVRSMFYLYDNRHNVAIGGFLLTDFMPEPFEPKRVDIYGQISFLDKQGNLTQIMSENFDCDTRFWK